MKKRRPTRCDTRRRALRQRCAAPGCGRPAQQGWEETGRFCAGCALGRDLFDRGERRERIFAISE